MAQQTFTVYRLAFTTPLHISNIRADYGKSEQTIHSDTLVAAVMQMWAKSGREEWIAQYSHMALSSLFPWLTDKEGNIRYFLPRPRLWRNSEHQFTANHFDKHKDFKKIAWVESSCYGDYLHDTLEIKPENMQGVFYAPPLGCKPELFEKSGVPRIMRPRDEHQPTKIFYMDRLYFNKNSGLHFIMPQGNIADPDFESRFNGALKLLAEEGIGTDRNVGQGKFSFTTDTLTLDLPDGATHFITLGAYNPGNECPVPIPVDPSTAYDTTKRGGWMGEPFGTYRKRSVNMFKPGSVLPGTLGNGCIGGRVVDVTPRETPTPVPYAVLRSGHTVLLPFK